ncbi:GlsB/YeaQ/YmgE family stress response membrane protein [Sphingomonas sp.]|uniref:GlsB/YeaQ/YmgE family stress response membrane protein n=1 Tax=Sphingomonas sp. TaxID=28214 RepID=UPI002DD693AC|nr:GlsB/YeaQ/YmgE family stress response membrane protein [Sphingomonas sp.]
MDFIIWIVIGGVIGWLASIVMRTDAQQGIFLNIVVGIVGSFIGGLILRSMGKINDGDFSLSALIAAFVGAIVLLGIVNLVRRGSVR